LGGGGITGAAYQLAALMAIEMATGWHPNSADVIIGTSAGANVAAVVRSDRLAVDALVHPHETRDDVAERVRQTIYRRGGTRKLGAWLRHGVAASLRSPGVALSFGSPAPYDPAGIGDLVRSQIGAAADRWPARPTAIVAIDIAARRRVAFGTVDAPDVTLADAVAASSAIPVMFNPHVIDGRAYVDGGVMSGTHADLVLGSDHPLDLVLVLAPLALEAPRQGGALVERVFDGVGMRALDDELGIISAAWPDTELLVLRPPPGALTAMRPNPMDARAAVPTFVRTLTGLKSELAAPAVWEVLAAHLADTSNA
jgi:NTE family protein